MGLLRLGRFLPWGPGSPSPQQTPEPKTMQSIDPLRELLRARAELYMQRAIKDHDVKPTAHGDVLNHLVGGLVLDKNLALATRTGEDVGEYMRDKLTLMRQDPRTSYYFVDTAAQAAGRPKQTPAIHKETARQKLERANGSDPFAGF
jgi:hypothetical protein